MSSSKLRGNECVRAGRVSEALQAYSDAIWDIVSENNGEMALECAESLGNASAVLLGIAKSKWKLTCGPGCHRLQHRNISSELLVQVEGLCCLGLRLVSQHHGNHAQLAAKCLMRRAAASGSLAKAIFDGEEERACVYCGQVHRERDDNEMAERLWTGELVWHEYASSALASARLTRTVSALHEPIVWHDAAVIETRPASGRGVYVAGSLPKGTVILREPIHTFQPFKHVKVCHSCSLPCQYRASCGCTVPLPLPSVDHQRSAYCSWRCLRACGDGNAVANGPIDVQLAVKVSRHLLLPEPYEELPVYSALSNSLQSLQHHVELLAEADVNAMKAYYDASMLPISESEFVKLCSAVRCNAVAVRRMETGPSSESTTASTDDALIGSAILPTVAMLNHSCDPNCVLSFDGSVAVVALVRDTLKGEQLCISYGPLANTMPSTSQRQAYLRERYGFVCACTACSTASTADDGVADVKIDPLTLDGVRTGMKCPLLPSCRGQLLATQNVSLDKMLFRCDGCLQQLSSAMSSEVLDSANAASELFDVAMASIEGHCSHGKLCRHTCEYLTEAKSSVEECVRLRRKLYIPTAAKLAACEDLAARVFAESGDYRMAARYCEAATARVATKFGSDSIEVGAELTKLAQLQCLAGELARASSTAAQGIRNLAPVSASRAADVRELERILAECASGKV